MSDGSVIQTLDFLSQGALAQLPMLSSLAQSFSQGTTLPGNDEEDTADTQVGE